MVIEIKGKSSTRHKLSEAGIQYLKFQQTFRRSILSASSVRIEVIDIKDTQTGRYAPLNKSTFNHMVARGTISRNLPWVNVKATNSERLMIDPHLSQSLRVEQAGDYGILIKKTPYGTNGKLFLSTGHGPLEAYFSAHEDQIAQRIEGKNILLLTPGVTQDVIDTKNKQFAEKDPTYGSISTVVDVPFVREIIKFIERYKGNLLIESAQEKSLQTSKQRQIDGIILTGGSLGHVAEFIRGTDFFAIMDSFLKESPNRWVSLQGAPLLCMGTNDLRVFWELDKYKPPSPAEEYGIGYTPNCVFIPHSDEYQGISEAINGYEIFTKKTIIGIPFKGMLVIE